MKTFSSPATLTNPHVVMTIFGFALLIVLALQVGCKQVDVYRPSDLTSLSSGEVKCETSQTIWEGDDKCKITVEFTNPSGCTARFNDGMTVTGNKASGNVSFVKLSCTGSGTNKCTYKITSVECIDGKHNDPVTSTTLVPDAKNPECNSTVQSLWPGSGAPPQGCYVTVAYKGTEKCSAILYSGLSSASLAEKGSASAEQKLRTFSKLEEKLFVKCDGTGSGRCNFQVVQVECPKK